MLTHRMTIFAVATTVVLLALAGSWTRAAEKPRFEAPRVGTPPVVDGAVAEWSEGLARLEAAPVSLAFRHDAEYLYVVVSTSDPGTRLLLSRAGFSLWWDPGGKEKKAFGITLPAIASGPPMDGPGAGGRPRPPRETPEREGQSGARGPGAPEAMALSIDSIGHIELAGSDDDDRRRFEMTYASTIGFAASASLNEGVLSYEVRVPLAVSEAHPYAIRTAPGALVGLGIETSEMPRPPRPEGERGGRGGFPGGGMGFPGGGGPGGGRGGRSGPGGPSGFSPPKPIRVWSLLQLAR